MHPDEVSAKPQPPTQLPDPDNLRDVLAYWVRLKRVEKGWSQERLALECELDRTYGSLSKPRPPKLAVKVIP